MRRIVSFALTVICLALVGTGLFMTLAPEDKGVVLHHAGTAGRLVADNSTATAFFETDGEALELTMLFAEEDDSDSVFRTRIRLLDGQSHSVIIGEPEDGAPAQRYTFVRTGEKVEMRMAPAGPITASFVVAE